MVKSSILSSVTITSVVFLLLSLTTACGRKGPDAPPDKTPPEIIATNPDMTNINNWPPNSALSVTFSEAVDPSTISFVLISAGTTTVPCTMIYSGTTATFTPASPLSYGAPYTATVSSGVTDLAGNPMPNNYFWGFVTGAAPDTTPPLITAAVPMADATGVSIKIALSVTFSEPVDQQTISFSLSSGSTSTSCKISYSGSTAIFTPLADLDYSTQYTATVSAGVQDLAGNAMPNSYIWSFVTITAPDTTPPIITSTIPRDGAGGVDTHKALSVTFSEPVDSATITFSLSTGETTVDCDMSYSGSIAIFTPRNDLKPDTLYHARVSAGVQDLAGNSMLDDYPWSFKTKK